MAEGQPFRYCLNTSTIRGQGLGLPAVPISVRFVMGLVGRLQGLHSRPGGVQHILRAGRAARVPFGRIRAVGPRAALGRRGAFG